jgi:hypothetical protein
MSPQSSFALACGLARDDEKSTAAAVPSAMAVADDDVDKDRKADVLGAGD